MRYNSSKQQGSILIMTLLLTTVLVGLLYMLLINVGNNIHTAQMQQDRITANAEQASCLTWAQNYLQQHAKANIMQPISMTQQINDHLQIKATITNAQDKFNLNRISTHSNWLMTLLRKHNDKTAAISMQNQIMHCLPGHAYTTYSPLAACPQLADKTITILKNYTVMLPQGASINLNVAKRAQLQLMFPKTPAANITAFIHARLHAHGFTKAQQVSKYIGAHTAAKFTLHSHYFWLDTLVKDNDQSYRFHSLITVKSTKKKRHSTILWQHNA